MTIDDIYEVESGTWIVAWDFVGRLKPIPFWTFLNAFGACQCYFHRPRA